MQSDAGEPQEPIATIVSLLETNDARVSCRYLRRYMVSPLDEDEPMLFVTVDYDGCPVEDSGSVIDENGERALTADELRTVSDAIDAHEQRGSGPATS
jgi:hypothetical protein